MYSFSFKLPNEPLVGSNQISPSCMGSTCMFWWREVFYHPYKWFFMLWTTWEILGRHNFGVFFFEMERQSDKKVKIIMSARCSEYNSKYDESSHNPCHLPNFLNSVALLSNTQCPKRPYKLVLLKGVIKLYWWLLEVL